MEKAREFQKPLFTCMCFIDYSKAFDCVDHPRLWNILHGMVIPEHIMVLLQNLYTSQEATVRTARWGLLGGFRSARESDKDASFLPAFSTFTVKT